MEAWSEAGIQQFRYMGPKDKKNREWCRKKVGKLYTRQAMEHMQNEFGQPAATFGGGWRCRHHWMPVPENLKNEDAILDYSMMV